MKNGYVIGGEKLSKKQFSRKYWIDGDAKYQFHTMDITDGLDERQQLLINNDRALKESINWHHQMTVEMVDDVRESIKQKSNACRRAIAALVVINAAIVWQLVRTKHS